MLSLLLVMHQKPRGSVTSTSARQIGTTPMKWTAVCITPTSTPVLWASWLVVPHNTGSISPNTIIISSSPSIHSRDISRVVVLSEWNCNFEEYSVLSDKLTSQTLCIIKHSPFIYNEKKTCWRYISSAGVVSLYRNKVESVARGSLMMVK